MKKLVLTTALVLTMGLCGFAQQGGGTLKRSKEYRETYRYTGREDYALMYRDGGSVPGLPYFGGFDDADAPIGSGVAVLLGLGAAYLVGKKRRED